MEDEDINMEEDGDSVIKDEFQAWSNTSLHGKNLVNLVKVRFYSMNPLNCIISLD